MHGFIDTFIRRPVFATVVILALCVLGIASYFRLGVDFFPNVEFPMVSVTTVLPGASPREVESEITDPLEEAVSTIAGVDEVRSISAEGYSLVFMVFQLDVDTDAAAQEVRDKVNLALPNLPEGVEPPVVGRLDPSAAPVIFLSLSADRPIVEVTEVADTLVRRGLEGGPGIGAVSIIGGRKREIGIEVDPIRMRALGVSAPELARALQMQNIQIPGGSLDNGPTQVNLRVQGKVETVDELGEIIVRSQQGSTIRVRDVATLVDGPAEATSTASRNGVPTVILAVRKQAGTNSVAVVDGVLAELPEIQAQLPKGYALEVSRDTSLTIRTSASNVTNHLVEGGLLAALVVLLFLGNVRATFISAIAIPTSIIATFGVLYLLDFTLNTMTLLALALAVGLVIDDAIVVLENIFRFIHDKNMPPMKAASAATREISLAVLATTLSLIAVFAPVGFIGGIPGRFLSSFGYTMAAAVAVSLVVSFVLTPTLSARLFRDREATKEGRLAHMTNTFYRPIEAVYMRVLGFCMQRRWVVVIAMLLSLASIPVVGVAIPKSFLPENDEAEFEVNLRAPEGYSLAATEIVGERISRAVRQVEGVDYTLLTVGSNAQSQPNVASIYVRLVDPDQRRHSQVTLMEQVREQVVSKQPDDLAISVVEVARFSGTGQSTQPVQFTVSGPDLDQLAIYGSKLEEVLRAHPAAADVETSLVLGKPELVAQVDRGRAGELGVTVADIATSLRLLVGGQKVSSFEDGGEQYEVRLRAARDYRADAEGLSLLTVGTPMGPVPLSDVVTLEESTGPASINRLNRQRQVTLAASVRPGAGQSELLSALDEAAAALDMPSSYKYGPAGQSKELARTARGFLVAIGLSFIFMYLVLAAQFESWLHPVTILSSLPLTLPFALVSLLIFGQSLNMFSGLGILVLFGVVKKNAILQVDHCNQLRAGGMDRAQAILVSNRDRLRPILMTTVAFVAGMLPLLLSKGIGSGLSRSMASLVVGGQTLSLLLTLLATPVLYSFFDDIQQALRRLFGPRQQPESTVEESVVLAEEI